MATENNVMWFDKMNILQSEKDMRVRICNRLEKELIDIFDWVAKFGSGFFYWELLDKKMHERYVKIILEEYPNIEYKEEVIELLAYYFYENTTDLIMKADGDKEKLKRALSKERARDCARNETNKAVNTLDYDDKFNKGYRYKEWQTTIDGKERPSHNKADKQKVKIDEPFIINGYQMDFPMDDSYDAPLTEILGCRCSVKYIK